MLGGGPGSVGDGGLLGGSWRTALWLDSFIVLGVRRGAAAGVAAFFSVGGARPLGNGGTAAPVVPRLLGIGMDPFELSLLRQGVLCKFPGLRCVFCFLRDLCVICTKLSNISSDPVQKKTCAPVGWMHALIYINRTYSTFIKGTYSCKVYET